MKIEEAIGVALDYEVKVRDHYAKSAKAIHDPHGKKFMEMFSKEEQGHVDYLNHCLVEWKKSGKVSDRPLKSLLPKGRAWITEAAKRVQKRSARREATATELEAVKMALHLENETNAFYRGLVGKLAPEDQLLFSKFLDIEDGHLNLVQAQLDSVQGMGFWFDVMEFRLEAE